MMNKDLSFLEKIKLCNDLRTLLENLKSNTKFESVDHIKVRDLSLKLEQWYKDLRQRQYYYDV